MTTVEEDACEAVCQEMGLTDDNDDCLADRVLVWQFCERFLELLASQGFRVRLGGTDNWRAA